MFSNINLFPPMLIFTVIFLTKFSTSESLKAGFYFVIRLKDTDFNGTASGYKGLEETFDIDFDKIITRDCPWKM